MVLTIIKKVIIFDNVIIFHLNKCKYIKFFVFYFDVLFQRYGARKDKVLLI